jgi:DNA-binding response OmpR family regulator
MAKILVVDDDRMICDLLQAVLSRHGHEVLTATDGGKGLELYQQHRPGITLLDFRMPKMDGIAVLKRIRALNPEAAVVMLTGGVAEALETQARELGVTDFLRKGASLEALVGAMERGLRPPVLSAPAPQAGRAVQGMPAESEAGQSILIVDDEEMIRGLLTKFLTRKGYRVRAARNGEEALAMVEQETPRIVILDMYMPGMNGVEVLRRLRARHYTGGVVALTASQDEQLLQQTLDLGSVDVMGKPVDLERLELVVQVCLVLTGP